MTFPAYNTQRLRAVVYLIAFAAATVTAVGWYFGFPVVNDPLHGSPSIKHIAALTFLFAVGGLYIQRFSHRQVIKSHSVLERQVEERTTELRESEARQRQIVDLIPLAAYTCDAQGVITYFNERAAELWGYRPGVGDREEKFCGSFRLYRPDGTQLPHDQTPVAEALKTGTSFRNCEVIIERPDSSHVVVLANIDPIRDLAGNIVGAINAFVDVTERRQAEESLRQRVEEVERLLEVVPAAVWVSHDPACRNITGNVYANQLYEVVPGENVSASSKPKARLFYTPEGRVLTPEELPMQVAAATNQEIRNAEIEVQLASGRRLSMLGNAVPLRDDQGKVRGAIASFLDITARKRAEDALRASDQRFELSMEATNDGLWDWNALTNEVYYSPTYYRILGYEAGGFPPTLKSWKDRIHPADLERTWQMNRDCVEGRTENFEVEYRLRHKDGTWRWILGRGKATHRNAQGRATRMIGTHVDITERKQAEAALWTSQQQLALALEAGQLGFWDWDIPSGRVHFGGCLASMLGYETGEIEPHVRAWERLVHPEEAAWVMAVLTEHLEDRTDFFECEHRLRHKDGSWRWILDRGQVVERDREGRPLRAVGTHSDVTARREAENALHEADRRKDEFLATLAHELRNPLAPIQTALQVFSKTLTPSPRSEQLLGMMQRQMAHLIRLVDDLLEVSRITRGKIELRKEPVNLATLLTQAIETSRPLIEAARHTLDVDLPPAVLRVEADPVRLTQVFANLLNNAAKYTEPGGSLRVVAEREAEQVLVRICDTGIGLTPEMLHRVFDLFTQADHGLYRAQGGLGIGLALVRHLVELHGGTVRAQSKGPGRGSEFVVSLPLLSPAPEANLQTESSVQSTARSGQRILIVDDNRDAAESLAELLTLTGHTLRTAYDGAEGLEVAEAFRPQILLLDLGMPTMNGYETCRELRTRPWGQAITVIALTGWGQEADRQQARAAGFDHHLVKPVDYAALTQLLADLSQDSASAPSSH